MESKERKFIVKHTYLLKFTNLNAVDETNAETFHE